MVKHYIIKAFRNGKIALILACIGLIFSFITAATLHAASAVEPVAGPGNNQPVAARQIIARFKNNSDVSRALSGSTTPIHGKSIPLSIPGLKIKRNMRFEKRPSGFRAAASSSALDGFDLSVLEITDASLSIAEAIVRLEASGQVEYAEPDYLLSIDTTPNDPNFGFLYGLNNTGQTGGTAGADINAAIAWDTTTGDSNIIVAVIDTGVQYDHPDLAANMWVNPGESTNPAHRNDGIDNDNNGYIDDVYGIDTFNGDSDPMDDNSHGTHVAGTIGAVGNNNIGISGVNWNVSIMALKYLSQSGTGNTSDAIELLTYVYNMKQFHGQDIKVSNASWGGGGFSQSLYDAIELTESAGILFAAAAGNDGTNNDTVAHYPSSYELDSIIAVAATDDNDDAYTLTNYGLTSVDLAAPGVSIYSTIPGDGYGLKTGTSMATPHVAGAAALLWAAKPDLSMLEVKQTLLGTVDLLASMNGITLSGGRLNISSALSCSIGNPVMDLTYPQENSTSIVGENTLFQLRISDCGIAITGASVSVSPDSADPDFNLLDNGITPDLTAGDGIYSGNWNPATEGTTILTITASDTGSADLNLQRSLTVINIPTYSASNTYPYAWSDASDGTNILQGGVDAGNLDDGDVNIPIEFDFKFYGSVYNDVWVHTNGMLKFGASNPLSFYEALEIPDSTEPNNYIAPFWDDLNPAVSSGGMYSKLEGSAPNRRLVIQWHDLKHFNQIQSGGPTGSVTFQAILYEGTNDIVVQYLDTTFDNPLYNQGANALAGIEFLDGSRGIEFANRAGGLNEEMAILYSPDSSSKKVLTVNDDFVGGDISDDQSPSQINCPQACYGQYSNNATIVLTAAAQAGFTFAGWNGAGCSGTGTCSVTMDTHKNVSASFVVTPVIQVTPNSGLTTTEAGMGNATFDMSLTTQPASNVTVALSSDDLSEGTVSPASVTFTSTNWVQAQTVTVTGQNDDLDDGDVTYHIITAPASSGDPDYAGLNPDDITLNNIDDDAAGFTIIPLNGLQTTETIGGTDSFTVRLNSEPTASVTLTLASSDTDEGTIDKGSLNFTASNWSQPQTVTVTGVDDDVDDNNQTYSIITAAATGGDYLGINPPDVSVTNEDNDIAGFTITPLSGLVTTEAEGSDTFTVKLNSEPTASVTLTLSSSNIDEGIIDKTSLAFTTSNWNQPQTVTITGVDDDVADNNQTYVIITAAATGGDYLGINPPDVSVSNEDNDTVGFTITPLTGLGTTEDGGTDTFTVKLNTEPTANVTLALSSSNTGEGTIDKTSLVFTILNWNLPQTVTITGVDDDVADANQTYSIITAAAAGGGYLGVNPPDVSVTNENNDTPGITIGPLSGLETTESGGSDTFTVKLDSEPTANVTLTLLSSNTAEGTVDKGSLNFTTVNWNQPQTVTVTGVDDDVDDNEQAYSIITNAATGGDYVGINPSDVSVTNQDNDTAGFTITPLTGLVTTEAEGIDTFTVKLNSEPTASVTLTLSSSNTNEGTIDKISLDFTTSNWNQVQTVTVTGVDDDVDDNDQTYSILTATATGGDYVGINPPDVSVTNEDNDTAGFTIAPLSGLVTTEAEGTDTFTVKLNSEPTAGVTLTLSSSNTAEGTIDKTFLNFTTINWNQAQTVTITGVNDDVDDNNQTYSIITGAATGGDYIGINPSDVSVTNQDNDTAGFTITPLSGLVTTEAGGTDTFTVKLNSEPTANVTLTLSSSNTNEGTIDKTSLDFTTSNWNQVQTVTVTGVNDDADDNDQTYFILTAAATGGDYAEINPSNVSVTNQDNDTAGFTITPLSGLQTTEAVGGTDTFTVRLNSEPTASVTLTLLSSNTAEGTIDKALLNFTPDDWDQLQTITVTGVNDDLDDGNIAYTILTNLSSSVDPLYTINPANISVTNIDDDDDTDSDGRIDTLDNCPLISNANQLDTDFDGEGDVCDSDDDDDTILDGDDNCPLDANLAQKDTDQDGEGDTCDMDIDNDTIENDVDNCPLDSNPSQTDTDQDGEGDTCDPDIDNDDYLNEGDNCPNTPNADQLDSDGNGIGDACDTINQPVDDSMCLPIRTQNSGIVIICL